MSEPISNPDPEHVLLFGPPGLYAESIRPYSAVRWVSGLGNTRDIGRTGSPGAWRAGGLSARTAVAHALTWLEGVSDQSYRPTSDVEVTGYRLREIAAAIQHLSRCSARGLEAPTDDDRARATGETVMFIAQATS